MRAWELGLMIGHFKEASVLKQIMNFSLIVKDQSMYVQLEREVFIIEMKERSDFGCLLNQLSTRICLANFVNQSEFRILAANQSQNEGSLRENGGY